MTVNRFCRIGLCASFAVWALVGTTTVYAQDAPGQFPDVPANHWAYQAVQDLASKGYVKGYPDGKFLGQRAMTRYEFAMVIEKMLQTINDLNAKIAALPAPTPPAPATPTGNFVTMDDLNKLQALVDSFKAQLDADTADIAAMKAAHYQDEIDALRQDVLDAKALAAKAQEGADRAYGFGQGRYQLSGYVQARFQLAESGNPTAYPGGTAANGGAQQSTNGNYAVGGNNETFFVRRARLKFTGAVTDNSVYTIQIDAANTSSTTPVTVKEANYAYTFGGGDPHKNVQIKVGQFANYFGFVIPQPAWDFQFIEYPLAFNIGGGGLWQNQDYDRGAFVAVPVVHDVYATAGVLNGTGTTSLEDKRSPDELYRLAYQPQHMGGFKSFDLGASYYHGTISRSLATNPSGDPTFTGSNYQGLHKDLAGADLAVETNSGWRLWTEYLNGRYDERTFASTETSGDVETAITSNAYAPNNKVDGYYAQLSYTINPRAAHPFTLTGGYDVFDRSKSGISAGQKDQFGNAIVGGASGSDFTDKNYGYGAILHLDKQAQVEVYYEQPIDVAHAATIAEPKKIGLFTTQLQVRF